MTTNPPDAASAPPPPGPSPYTVDARIAALQETVTHLTGRLTRLEGGVGSLAALDHGARGTPGGAVPAMSKAPKWQRAHIQKCRAALGLDDPAFHLFVHQRKVVAGDKACLGFAQTDAAYQRATLTLQRGLAENDLSYEVLTHECFHAACGAQDRAVTRIIELLPKRQRAHAERLWSDGKEETATRIARGLMPLLRAMEDRP